MGLIKAQVIIYPEWFDLNRSYRSVVSFYSGHRFNLHLKSEQMSNFQPIAVDAPAIACLQVVTPTCASLLRRQNHMGGSDITGWLHVQVIKVVESI